MNATASPWAGALGLADRFHALDTTLHAARWAWRPDPAQRDPDWARERGDLAGWLARLTDTQVNDLESDPDLLLSAIGGFIAEANMMHALLDVPAAESQPLPSTSRRLGNHMSDRKWAQITALLRTTPPDDAPVTDWCSGKGHLGRSIAQLFDRPVTCLEADADLIAGGTALAARAQIEVRFERLDLSADSSAPRLPADSHVYALHACGELHEHLLAWLPATGAARATIVPCCHHKSPRNSALSRTARDAQVVPDHRVRRLAVTEQVTASGHERRTHALERAWRFGLEAMVQELEPDATAPRQLPRPSAAALRAGFRSSCEEMARSAGIRLPDDIDWGLWERWGLTRHARVRRLELVPHAFRRAIELWLTLDRALCIAEYGWQVNVSTLCSRNVTPRNLMIDARAPV